MQLFDSKYNERQSEKKIIFRRLLQENEEKYQRHNEIYLMNARTSRKTKEEEKFKRYTDIV